MKKENLFKGFGAILGDIVGSIYELKPIYKTDFVFIEESSHYTDDTIMTLATMNKILHNSNYALEYKWMGNKYFGDYYGKNFKSWIKEETVTTNFSYGNGTAMRVSPIGYHYSSLEEVYNEAIKSAVVSHNHHEAIKGAMAIASSIFILNNGGDKGDVHQHIQTNFYDLNFELKRFEKFKVSCQDSVPVAIRAFLDTPDIEHCIRKIVSLGGDCDTIASIAGELFVALDGGIDAQYIPLILAKLDKYQISILDTFNSF